MLVLKDDSIEIGMLTVPMMFALRVAEAVYDELSTDLVITSGDERGARHSLTSLHYSGNAVDIRTHNLPMPSAARDVMWKILSRLNIDYDVLLESQGTSNEHIHIEYQPRRKS